MKIVFVLIKSALVGLGFAFVFAIIGGLLGDKIAGPDADGNHYDSWIWLFNGFLIGGVAGFIGTIIFEFRKKKSF